jgi:hypothetical protein
MTMRCPGRGTAMPASGIFISYRRQDAQSAAGRLADSLERRFGKAQIFRDVETIQPGVDFVEAIEGALSSCSVMLAVIGRRWMGEAGEQSRLHLANDWIRLEIAAALKRNIRVIPVLVEGASPPADADLPEDLKPLARRQAHTLSDERWDYDVQQLAAALESVGVQPLPAPGGRAPVPAEKPRSSKLVKTLAWIGGIVVVLMVIGVATESSNSGYTPAPPPRPAGLASGTPTSACGCWGYVSLGASQPNPACASGMEVAIACPAYCAAGGYQWQKRCM